MRRNTNFCVADFETTSINDSDNKVYSWALGVERTKLQIATYKHKFKITPDIHYKEYKGLTIYYGISIDSFIEFTKSYRGDSKLNVFFTNLGGFDGHFIKDYLIQTDHALLQNLLLDNSFMTKEQFEHHRDLVVQKIPKKITEDEDKTNWIIKHWSYPYDDTEFSFIAKNNRFKCINLGENIQYVDTLNLVNKSVKDMGKALTQLHNCDNDYYKKLTGAINYDKEITYNTIEELEQDGNELDYLLQDIFVPYTFMKYFISETLEDTLKVEVKLTAGATAMNDWRKGFKHKIFNELYTKKQSYIQKNGKVKYKYYSKDDDKYVDIKWCWKVVDEIFNKMFPHDFDTAVALELLRPYYRGGLVMVNPKFQGLVVFLKNHIDINSSFPSVMKSNRLFPIGQPLSEKPDGKHVYLREVMVLKDLYNLKGMPFIPEYFNFGKSAKYLNHLTPIDGNGEPRVLYLTNCEYDQFIKQYNVKDGDISILSTTYFKAIEGTYLFGDYYDKWYKLKEEAGNAGNKTLKDIYKIPLNSLYGYWARRWKLSETYLLPEDGVKTDLSFDVELDPIYLPIGIFITSYARLKLIKASENSWIEHGVYCDTDSIFYEDGFKFNEEEVKFDKSKLGYWDEDTDFDYGVFVKPKQYNMWDSRNNRYETHIAGLSFGVEKTERTPNPVNHLTLKQMLTGAVVPYQLRPHRTKFGVWLEDYDKYQKPIWEAEPIGGELPRVKDKEYILGEYEKWKNNIKSMSM